MHEIKRSPVTVKTLQGETLMFKKLIQTIVIGCAIALCFFTGIDQSQSFAAALPASMNLQSGVDRFLTSIPDSYFTIATIEELKIHSSLSLMLDNIISSLFYRSYKPRFP